MMLKEQLVKYKEKWAALSLRERRSLMAGAAALGVILLYLVIWSPFMDRVASLRKQVSVLQKTLVWVRQADKALSAAKPIIESESGLQSPAALLDFLQQRLLQDGLKEAVTQLKQSSQDAVSLQFKEVSFDKLVSFMLDVAAKQNVLIKQVSVRSLSSPGMVDAQIVFVMST